MKSFLEDVGVKKHEAKKQKALNEITNRTKSVLYSLKVGPAITFGVPGLVANSIATKVNPAGRLADLQSHAAYHKELNKPRNVRKFTKKFNKLKGKIEKKRDKLDAKADVLRYKGKDKAALKKEDRRDRLSHMLKHSRTLKVNESASAGVSWEPTGGVVGPAWAAIDTTKRAMRNHNPLPFIARADKFLTGSKDKTHPVIKRYRKSAKQELDYELSRIEMEREKSKKWGHIAKQMRAKHYRN